MNYFLSYVLKFHNLNLLQKLMYTVLLTISVYFTEAKCDT